MRFIFIILTVGVLLAATGCIIFPEHHDHPDDQDHSRDNHPSGVDHGEHPGDMDHGPNQ